MLEGPEGQRHHACSNSHNDGITPERRRIAEEVDEGNDNAQRAKPQKNSHDVRNSAFQHTHAGAGVPTVAAHLVQFAVKLIQFVMKFRGPDLI